MRLGFVSMTEAIPQVSEVATLTIAVPTFERAEVLRDLLQDLGLALERHPGELHVVISDNASGDGTAEVIREWLGSLAPASDVTVRRNPENLGPSRNLLQAMGAARGTFVSFLGDDDRIDHEQLSLLLAWLRENPDCVAVCASPGGEPFEVASTGAFLNRLWEFGNAWGGVVRTDLWKEASRDPALNRGAEATIWPQICIGLDAVLREPDGPVWLSTVEFGHQGEAGSLTFADHRYYVASLSGLIAAARVVDARHRRARLRWRMLLLRTQGFNRHLIGILGLAMIGKVSAQNLCELRERRRASHGLDAVLLALASAASRPRIASCVLHAAAAAVVASTVVRPVVDGGRRRGIRAIVDGFVQAHAETYAAMEQKAAAGTVR